MMAGHKEWETTMTTLKAAVRPGEGRNPANRNVLDDLVTAMETYAENYIEIEIYDVNPPGSVINVGESVPFKLRARNNGPMHVQDLELKMIGRNGCRVGQHGWVGGQLELTSSTFPQLRGNMPAGDWVVDPTDHYHLFAGGEVTDADLLEVVVDKWNADWGYLLVNRSLSSVQARAVFNGDVVGS